MKPKIAALLLSFPPLLALPTSSLAEPTAGKFSDCEREFYIAIEIYEGEIASTIAAHCDVYSGLAKDYAQGYQSDNQTIDRLVAFWGEREKADISCFGAIYPWRLAK